MRIAVDARELAPHATGVGRYLAEILHAWSIDSAASDAEVVLYLPEGPRGPAAPEVVFPVGVGARISTKVLSSGLSGTAWEQVTLPLGVGRSADVLWAPAYSAPLCTPLPTVVTVHDVSYCAHPEWFTRREGLRRRWTTRLAAANAARVLTVSEFSRQEIVRWLGVPAARVAVTPNGLSLSMRPPARTDRDDAAPLILFVGSQLNRRARRRQPLAST